jgi:hypothetical protein
MSSEIYYFAGSHFKKYFTGTLKCWVVSEEKETCAYISGAKSLGAFDDTKLYMSSTWKRESRTTECADGLS